MHAMAGETARLQAELAKVNAAYVAAACEHREKSAALQARVKALETDLAVSKDTCKNQEYLMQQALEKSGNTRAGGREDGELGRRTAELEKRTAELEKSAQELDAARTRIRELEERENETAGLRKRMRELEAVEKGWLHLRGVLLTRP
jgi:hypothetical protein